jgi:hypothetical protein
MRFILLLPFVFLCISCNSGQHKTTSAIEKRQDNKIFVNAPASPKDTAEDVDHISRLLWRDTIAWHKIPDGNYAKADSFYTVQEGHKYLIESCDVRADNLPHIRFYNPDYSDFEKYPSKKISVSGLKLDRKDMKNILNTFIIEIAGKAFPLNDSHQHTIGLLDDRTPDEIRDWPEVYTGNIGKRNIFYSLFGRYYSTEALQYGSIGYMYLI